LLGEQRDAFSLTEPDQQLEEVVLFSRMRGQIIRPLGASSTRFALVVFELVECNLVVARLELTRFVFASG
jgi:hypothetical protein